MIIQDDRLSKKEILLRCCFSKVAVARIFSMHETLTFLTKKTLAE